MFHNRFYLGETWLKKGDMPLKGTQQPLVDESTFTRVQQVLRQHDKNKQRTKHHQYLLRRLLFSLDAQSRCWSETHPRKGISYYRSQAKVNGSHVFYNTKNIEAQLSGVFRRMTITEKSRQKLKKAAARLAKLERMERNLQRLVMEEDISFEDFGES